MPEVILDLHNSPELRGSQIRCHGEVVVDRLEGVGARDRSAINHRRLILAIGHVASSLHAVVGRLGGTTLGGTTVGQSTQPYTNQTRDSPMRSVSK